LLVAEVGDELEGAAAGGDEPLQPPLRLRESLNWGWGDWRGK
jgi:hypothetical protein